MKFKSIGLFSGCGGLSLGLQQAGFEHQFALEINKHAFETYRYNLIKDKPYEKRWPKWLKLKENDILQVLKSNKTELKNLRGKIDLVEGGPPCQGFSMNGKRNPNDPRNEMVGAFLKFVKYVKPKIVLIENVTGLMNMPYNEELNYPEYIEKQLAKLGYTSYFGIVTASDWGVPQIRPRFILVGISNDIKCNSNPLELLNSKRIEFLRNIGLEPFPIGTEDAIGDLVSLNGKVYPDPEYGKSGYKALKYNTQKPVSQYIRLMRANWCENALDTRLPNQSSKVIRRMKKIISSCEPGRAISKCDKAKFGIKKRTTILLNSKAPSPTITTLPDDFIHYSEPRTLTVREMARIQSFPDWFKFCGPYTTGGDRRKFDCPRYTQVGNAVPPLLANALGETLISILA